MPSRAHAALASAAILFAQLPAHGQTEPQTSSPTTAQPPQTTTPPAAAPSDPTQQPTVAAPTTVPATGQASPAASPADSSAGGNAPQPSSPSPAQQIPATQPAQTTAPATSPPSPTADTPQQELPDVDIVQPSEDGKPKDKAPEVKPKKAAAEPPPAPQQPPPPKIVKKTQPKPDKPVAAKAATPPKPIKAAVKAPSPKPAKASPPSPPPVEASPEVSAPVQNATASAAPDFAARTSVAADQIAATSGANLTDALQDKPGISGSTFAPGANRPIIRGLDNTRVRIQESGIQTGDASDISEDHAVPVDPCSARTVEVIRGPGALQYTNKVAGGVVNAETERIPTYIPERGYEAEVRGGLTSVDDGREGCFRATAGVQGIVVHAGAFARSADDYVTPQGEQFNSFVDSRGYALGASLVGGDGFIGVSYARLDSLYGIPGEEALAEVPRIDLGQYRISARGEWRAKSGGLEALRFWYGFSDYAHDEVVLEDPAEGDAIASRFTNKEHELRVEAEHQPVALSFGDVRGKTGLQFSNRKLAGLSVEGDNLIEPGETQKIAVYQFEEARLTESVRLLASLRVEHAAIEGATIVGLADPSLIASQKSFVTISAGAGLLYDLGFDITSRISALHLERAPEAPELFSKGAHEATGTFEIGDPNLTEETANTIEVGLSKSLGAFRFDAAAYYTSFDNFIVRQLTGETCDETVASCSPGGGGLDQAIFIQRDARFYGVELSGEYDVQSLWNGVWGVSAQYDFVNASFETGGNVPRIPPHRLGGGIYYRDPVWRAHLKALHAFDQDRVAEIETPTDGYTLLSAEISATVQKLSNGDAANVIIGLRGDNLLDQDVRNHASFKKDEVLQPGIGVRLFGIVRF